MFCLIRPPAVEAFRVATTSITLPLGLAYIAGSLREAGRPYSVLDAVAEAPRQHTSYIRGYLVGLRLEQIVERVPADATLIGITVVFTHEWPAVARLIRLLKDARPDVPIVLGGEHVTSMPEFCLSSSPTDYLVVGEGEETILELLDALDGQGDLAAIPGLVYRNDDGIQVNPRRARRAAVDEIPPPDWESFDVDTYNEQGLVGGMDVKATTIPILATRGCPYQCTYCSSPNMWTPRWIPRDPVKVVDEIEGYMRRYGATNFPFQDLTAILDRDWILAFGNEILDRGLEITWQLPTGTRSEAVDDEVALLLKRTGMVNMSYAPESGSERIRTLIRKRMKTDSLMASIASSAKARLNIALFVVIGFPHDTEEMLAENIEFMKRVRQLGVTDMVVGYYMALPGTELFNSLYEAGRIKLDRTYFAHDLQGLALWPTTSYNDHMGRWKLFYWKLKLQLGFYATKTHHADRSGMLASLWRAASGIFQDVHESRVQTAVRNAFVSTIDGLRARLGRRWMPIAEERAMLEGWDDLYRELRGQLTRTGVLDPAPVDSSEIHTQSVIKSLRKLHGASRVISDPAKPAA